jgi:hypothetical protein
MHRTEFEGSGPRDEMPNRPTAVAVGLFACNTFDRVNN